MRIPITDKPAIRPEGEAGLGDYSWSDRADAQGPQASESGGSAGGYVPGGERTEEQNASEALEEHNATRQAEEEVFGQQMAGEVETQTTHHHPAAAHPEEGLPSESPDEDATDNAGNETSSDQQDTPAGSSPTTDSAPANTQAEDLEDKYLRLAAEFHNYKQQVTRREAEVRDRAVKGLVHDLLPVLDNFERAVDAARNAQDIGSLKMGVEYILQQLQEALRGHGFEPIMAQGRPFDPLRHDALEQVPNTEHPEGTVVDEATRGWSHKGQVLRPSRVRVAGPST